MKLAIMQPYLFPYIGYFQLINSVDTFVVFDDVHFIKKGWINRNNILINNDKHMFTLPIQKVSQNKLINEMYFINSEEERKKLLLKLEHAYKKAPEFNNVYPLVLDILLINEDHLVNFIENSLARICEHIGISTTFLRSSEITKDNELMGASKIINICETMNASHYINPIGGIELYDYKQFSKHKIHLSFLQSNMIEYKQFGEKFIPWMSILDVLMFVKKEQLLMMMDDFLLIEGEEIGKKILRDC